MGWQKGLRSQGTQLEMKVWKILADMKLNYISNESLFPKFRNHSIEVDIIVEGVLAVEVQSTYFHSKKVRVRKDASKKEALILMGYGYLELWDHEIEYAYQKKRGTVWMPYVKKLIHGMLGYAFAWHREWSKFTVYEENLPWVKHPDYPDSVVRIDLRND